MKENNIDHSSLWKLLGKTIASNPASVEQLLKRHNLLDSKQSSSQALVAGVMNGLARKDTRFQNDLTSLLSAESGYDNFIGAIAGAVGAVANVVGGAQKNKAIKLQAKATREQAKSQTFQSILAYKAQQEQNKMGKLKLDQAKNSVVKKTAAKDSKIKTWLLIGGVATALIVIGLVVHQRVSKAAINQVTLPIK